MVTQINRIDDFVVVVQFDMAKPVFLVRDEITQQIYVLKLFGADF